MAKVRDEDEAPAERPAAKASPPKPTEASRPKPLPKAKGTRRKLPRVLVPPLDYVDRTRHGIVNLLFLAPWLLVYVLCRWGAGPAIATQAERSIETALRILGAKRLLSVLLLACLLLCAVILQRIRRGKGDGPVYPWMLIEGTVYGLLLPFVAEALSLGMPVGRWIGLMRLSAVSGDVRALGIAIGAGIFEEVVFRGLLCYALYRVMRTIVGADRGSAGVLAVVVSALVFSAYHHWGAGGEPWDAVKFTFRFHAGVVLGAVFLTRGLAIAAFAHGLYDAIVLLGHS